MARKLSNTLQLQLGDFLTRIRRATRATGTLQLGLDQDIVGDIVIANLDQDPYRQEPRTFSQFLSVGAGAAGNASMVALQAAPQTVVCVDAIVTTNTQTPGPAINLSVNRNAVFPDPNYALGQTQCFLLNTAETISGPAGGGVASQCLVHGTNAHLLAPPAGQTINIVESNTTANLPVTVRLPNPIVLYGSPPNVTPLGDELIVFNGVAAASIFVGFWGREYVLLQGASNQ